MKLWISLMMILIVFSSCKQVPVHHYAWKPYSQKAVEEAVAHKRPVVIDFFAEWCPICHDLDRALFSRPDVQAKLDKVTALRVDATNQEDPNVAAVAQQYQVDGLPTIIFLDSRGKEIPHSRLEGFATPSDFAQAYAMANILQ